jgi:hypothetical protein
MRCRFILLDPSHCSAAAAFRDPRRRKGASKEQRNLVEYGRTPGEGRWLAVVNTAVSNSPPPARVRCSGGNDVNQPPADHGSWVRITRTSKRRPPKCDGCLLSCLCSRASAASQEHYGRRHLSHRSSDDNRPSVQGRAVIYLARKSVPASLTARKPRIVRGVWCRACRGGPPGPRQLRVSGAHGRQGAALSLFVQPCAPRSCTSPEAPLKRA